MLFGGGDCALNGAFDLLAGEGGGWGTEDEGDGDAFESGVEGFAAEGGDEIDGFEKFEIQAEDQGFDFFKAEVFGDDEGNIALNGGEAGKGSKLGNLAGAGEQRGQIELGGGGDFAKR